MAGIEFLETFIDLWLRNKDVPSLKISKIQQSEA